MGGENMTQSKEAGEVDHAGDDTQQRRQERLQARQGGRVIRRTNPVSQRGGRSSER